MLHLFSLKRWQNAASQHGDPLIFIRAVSFGITSFSRDDGPVPFIATCCSIANAKALGIIVAITPLREFKDALVRET